MFETITYEVILQRMLDRVIAQDSNIDTREGSIVYNALAPAAVELQNVYISLDATLKETFINSANSKYLDDKVSEYGMKRIPATKAIKKGEFNIDVPIGNRFSGDNLNYVVVEKISLGVFKLECETPGTVGNEYLGTLIPIEYVEGLTSAELTEVLIPARDVETDVDLRKRFFNQVQQAPIDGNIGQYLKWATDFGSIGKAKVFSLWNGVNTVKVSILNSNNEVASAELIANFQEYLDPNSEGLGNGVAPIGAVVTVSTATEVDINISANVTLESGYTEIIGVEDELAAWFKEISYEKSSVNYYELAALLLANASIAQINTLTVNSGTADITLTAEQIPVIGTLSLVVV